MTIGCVVDEDMAVDRGGRFHIVMSTGLSRPANAMRECGFAWLPWGPDPKGIAIMRNMLPSASVQAPGPERGGRPRGGGDGRLLPAGQVLRHAGGFEDKYGC